MMEKEARACFDKLTTHKRRITYWRKKLAEIAVSEDNMDLLHIATEITIAEGEMTAALTELVWTIVEWNK